MLSFVSFVSRLIVSAFARHCIHPTSGAWARLKNLMSLRRRMILRRRRILMTRRTRASPLVPGVVDFSKHTLCNARTKRSLAFSCARVLIFPAC